MGSLPALYDDYAEWFHLLSSPADYDEEAQVLTAMLAARGCQSTQSSPKKMLELGSGGGNLASHLTDFELTLSDLSEPMLALSRTIHPSCRHVQGDMRSLRIGEQFDAVIIHDAIDYMTTEADLFAAFTTAAEHLEPGGIAVVMPDFVRETFAPATDHGGHDGDDGRGLRYLEWQWDPDPSDCTVEVAYACLLRDTEGATRAVHDRHSIGLFPRQTWIDLLERAGFRVEKVSDPWRADVFVGTREA